MLTTAPTSAPGARRSFETLLNEAGRQNRRQHATRAFALDHGVDEKTLAKYASGGLSMYERHEIEAVIARCAWAHQIVVNIVKKRRQQQKKRSAA